MMHFDPLYFAFLIPGMLLSFWASTQVKRTFAKYQSVTARSGLTGAQVAERIIQRTGLENVRLEETPGKLSDHYDPFSRTLRLSHDVFHGRSLSAVGVAAHEAGHAIQHATGYGPLKFRSLVVKPAMIGSNLGGILCAVGLGLQVTSGGGGMVIWAGIALFSLFVLFTLVTLPVEFNASHRSLALLEEMGVISGEEIEPTRSVLRAAALTYVAAAITAILQLLYFLYRAGLLGGRKSDE
jgi:uncharacterized protein